MNKIIIILLVLFTVTACTNESRVEKLRYKGDVLKYRESKNKFFKESDQSPLLQEDQWSFTSLNYYPFNYDYRVKAVFTSNSPKEFIIDTSSGVERSYMQTGTLIFTIKNKEYKLSTFQDESSQASAGVLKHFVPFQDLTSNTETYNSGRYLDLTITDEKNIFIDFNLAYNPYCAYNNNYSCPLPPAENQLNVAIQAGEKKFKD